MKPRLYLRATILVSMLMISTDSTAQLTATVNVSTSNGQHTYNYVVTNVGSNPIFEVSLASAPTTFATAPTGWMVQSFFSNTRLVTQWLALDPSSAIQPGASLSGFSVVSQRTPGHAQIGAMDTSSAIYDDTVTQGPAGALAQVSNVSTRLLV